MNIDRIKFMAMLILVVVATNSPDSGLVAQSSVELPGQRVIASAIANIEQSVVQLEMIGGASQVAGTQVARQPATGTIVGEGLIVTAAFHLAHNPTTIFVRMSDGKRLPAEVLARNHARQIVMLKLSSTDAASRTFAVPRFVERSQIRTGQTAIAAGRSMNLEQLNVSTGIISAIHRIRGKAIQTDAMISPGNFGGPLIDLEGNVLGILVPMSPQGDQPTDGTDWYDSGIGFAVPLNELRLAEMAEGKDLRSGLLGVSFQEDRGYASPAVVATCLGTSPAATAGMKPDDEIVEIDGTPIRRVAEARHAIGNRYEGDRLQIVFRRGEENRTVEIELAGEILPFRHPMLGIVPVADIESDRVEVQHVIAGSPASKAETKLKIGDVIVSIGEKQIDDRESITRQLITHEIGDPIKVAIERGGEPMDVELTLGELSAKPVELAIKKPANSDDPLVGQEGLVEIKVPESSNRCQAYFPPSDRALGLLVWVGEPGPVDATRQLENWKRFCDERAVALLIPQSNDPGQWSVEEIEFINKAMVEAQQQNGNNIDPARIAIGGQGTGGVMASMTVISQRDSYRGLICLDTPGSKRMAGLKSEPANRLMVLMIGDESKVKIRKAIDESADRLSEQGFPVYRQWYDEAAKAASVKEAICRWVETLSRF